MDEKEANQNLSTQKVLLPRHDPGWNDPPKWAYVGAQSSVTPTKRILNKRVAFPLGSVHVPDKESSSNKTLNLPPPVQSLSNVGASHLSLIHDFNKDVETESEVKFDKEQTLNTVLTNLESVINDHILDKSKADEVKKRLDIMKIAWLEDKLNNQIYKNILDLSIALREGNVENADGIHVALMMQHASLCSTWIPGIRHIILGLKSRMPPSSATNCQNLEPHLLPVTEKE